MIKSYFLKNDNGVAVEFCNSGGRIYSIKLAKDGIQTDIIAGAPTIKQYIEQDEYMGAICGRYANRISNSSFSLNGNQYCLSNNENKNHLHGGFKGFNQKKWTVNKLYQNTNRAYKLEYLSEDGEEGYPGNLSVVLTYELTDNNEFIIDLKAETDKSTIINLTSHPYFNLKGYGNIFDHKLKIIADNYCPVDEDLIPTGEIFSVDNTDLDFRSEKFISDIYLNRGSCGLDRNFVLRKEKDSLSLAAILHHPGTNRSLELYTTQSCLQVYTGKHFNYKKMTGKNDLPLKPFDAVALEAQNYPDAPNKDKFEDAYLKAGEIYHQKIVYKFIF